MTGTKIPKQIIPNQTGPRRFKSRQEIMLASTEYQLQRLKDLTRIDSKKELDAIFRELTDFIDSLEAHQIEIKDVGEGEYKRQVINFYELTDDEVRKLEEILDSIKVYGFPENSPEKNTTDYFIDNKWAVEIFYLMRVTQYASGKLARDERIAKLREQQKIREEELRKEVEAREKYIKEATEEHMRRYKERIQNEKWEDEESERRLAQDMALARFEMEKLSHKEKLKKEQEILKMKVEKRLHEIMLLKLEQQQFTSSELEERLRDTSPVDEFYAFGNLMNNKKDKRPRKAKYPKERFIYDDDLVNDVDAQIRKNEDAFYEGGATETFLEDFTSFVDFENSWLTDRLVSVDSLKEWRIWNEFLPSLELFEPRFFTWHKEGKNTNILRANTWINIKELDLRLEPGQIITGEMQEAIYMAAVNHNSDDKEERKIGQSALKLVLQMHLGLILYHIKDLKYFSPGAYRNISGDDMFSFGVIGIIASLAKYDDYANRMLSSGTRVTPPMLRSYISKYIEGYIRNLNYGDYDFSDTQVSIPEHVKELRAKVAKLRRILARTFPEKAVDEERVRDELVKKVEAKEEGYTTVSDNRAALAGSNYDKFLRLIFDTYEEIPHSEIGEEIQVGMHDVDMLGNALLQEPTQERHVLNVNLKNKITTLLMQFPPREEYILRARFGIGNDRDRTLESIGDMYDLSKDRIRQLEMRVLRSLSHPRKSRQLVPYFNSLD